MTRDEILKIVKEAAKLKETANLRSENFKYYPEAEKLYLSAYTSFKLLKNINEVEMDLFPSIYLYESLDCKFSYNLKLLNFDVCVTISQEQLELINSILRKYPNIDDYNESIKSLFMYLINNKVTAEIKSHFPIGRYYFEKDDFKKALYYFRRSSEILKKYETSHLNEAYLKNYYLNSFILKVNISQCQIGILKDEKEHKEFMERQIIKELLSSYNLALEVTKISDDPIYSNGLKTIQSNINKILSKALNSWQKLFDYTKSSFLLDLMRSIDPNRANEVVISNANKKDYFLFYTHGFNTRGEWKDWLTEVITYEQRNTNVNFILLPWDYGKFKVKFLIKSARQKAKEKFIARYNEILDTYGDCERKCLIAHSFGTYITGTALQENANFICNKVIFAGTILDKNYNWNKLKINGQVDSVHIEICKNDGALLLAKLMRTILKRKWIGFAGREGFNGNYYFMTFNETNKGHSGMLNKDNMRTKRCSSACAKQKDAPNQYSICF
ncbi:MAG: hypothetical protein JSU07_12560 [Bacteroidetes bacterium]|nr:hypothetical protein [Bacteroidota bacterium]